MAANFKTLRRMHTYNSDDMRRRLCTNGTRPEGKIRFSNQVSESNENAQNLERGKRIWYRLQTPRFIK